MILRNTLTTLLLLTILFVNSQTELNPELELVSKVFFSPGNNPAKNVKFVLLNKDSSTVFSSVTNDSGFCTLKVPLGKQVEYIVLVSFDRFPKWGRYFQINTVNLPKEKLKLIYKPIHSGFSLDSTQFRLTIKYPGTNIIYYPERDEFGFDMNSFSAMMFIYKATELLTDNMTAARRQDSVLLSKEIENKAKESEISKQKLIRNFSLLGIFILIIVALIIYRSLIANKKQKQIIFEQKKLVDEKNKEILDSIHYAHRIQKALITSEKYIHKNLSRLSNSTKRTPK